LADPLEISDFQLPGGREAYSEDSLLGGRVRFFQPKSGYRAAIDPVLLGAAVPARDGDKVLDVGAGAGAASLCLAARVADVRVAGVDLNPDLVRLADHNAAANGYGGRLEFMVGDLLSAPVRLAAGTFDHVMANPPHLDPGGARPSPDAAKVMATVEGSADLRAWLRFCLLMVRPQGSVTIIHRADRLADLLAALGRDAGGVVVFPLWPGPRTDRRAKPAKRVLVRFRKGARTPLVLAAGMVLHEADGSYTASADAVLRHAGALEIDG